DHLGVARVDLADDPLPERQRLRVRIVDAKDAHARVGPVEEDRTQLGPERFAGRSQPVEVDDVLVAFGRVLGRLDGAVGAAVEPLRVLLHVWMVRGALEGDVERHVDVPLPRGGDEALEVLHGAELRMDRFVAAFGAADGPGASYVFGCGLERVVVSLARRAADGMERRQVDDVEAELLDVRDHRLGVAEGAVASRGTGRAREELVPGAEDGALALREDAQFLMMPDGHAPIRMARRRLREPGIERRRDGGRRLPGAKLLLGLPQARGIGGARGARRGSPLGRGSEQQRTFQELGMDLAARVDLALELAGPATEKVRPGLDREGVEAVLEERKLPLPRIVAEGAHGHFAGLRLGRRQLPPAQHDRQLIVAFLEDIGGDADRLADGALDGVPAAVDPRLHVLDDGAPDASGHPAASFVPREPSLPRAGAGTMWAFPRLR